MMGSIHKQGVVIFLAFNISLVTQFLFNPSAQAQRTTKAECEAGHWSLLGAKDALNGLGEKAFSKREKACTRHKAPSNFEAWQSGYRELLPTICAVDFSYGMGLNGNTLNTACPLDLMRRAQLANEHGLKLHTARNRYKLALDQYNYTVGEINRLNNSIRSAQRKLRKKELSPDEISKLQSRISSNNSSIYKFESNLSYQRDAVDLADRDVSYARQASDRFLNSPLYTQGFKSSGPQSFENPVSLTGTMIEGSKMPLTVKTIRAERPILFPNVYISLDDFSLPITGRYEGKQCKPQRKIRKALRKEWKALQKATLELQIYEMVLSPPTYERNYIVDLYGNAYLPGDVDMAEYFISRGLAVRATEPALSGWYKNENCFSRPQVNTREKSNPVAPEPITII